MRGKGLLVLAAVVLAVGAFIYLYERKLPTTEEAKASADKVFPDLTRDAVVGLEITNSYGAFTLSREGSHWLLSAPVACPADDGAVGTLLGSLVELKRERTLAPGEVKPADYGLDQPKLAVVVKVSGGRRYTLSVGNETALGGNRAVSLGGPEVILCSGWFTRDLDKGLADWRSRDVVDVFADQVASFTLEAGPDRVHAVRWASSGSSSSRSRISPTGTSCATSSPTSTLCGSRSSWPTAATPPASAWRRRGTR